MKEWIYMEEFYKTDFELFRSIATMSQSSLKRALSKTLRKAGYSVHETNYFIFATGDIPVALVAHLDTVFKTPPKEIFHDKESNVLWSPQGLGADDRAGVFAILKILQSGRRPHIIFTTDEEIGGVGAAALVKNKPKVNDIKYMIELDRNGEKDCVFYQCDNREFVDYVELFGFIEDYGSFSDISVLAPEWEVAAVNLSIGYRDEHSIAEVLFINHMMDTIQKVEDMLDDADAAPYFKYVPIPMYMKCDLCGKTNFSFRLLPIHNEHTGKPSYYCDKCLPTAKWCMRCGLPYNEETEIPEICPDCFKEIIDCAEDY
jgi:hypothetical protein